MNEQQQFIDGTLFHDKAMQLLFAAAVVKSTNPCGIQKNMFDDAGVKNSHKRKEENAWKQKIMKKRKRSRRICPAN